MQEIELWPLAKLIQYTRNPRKNDHAVDKLAAAIKEFGFRIPILAKSDGLVIDGHLRLKAAIKLGMDEVPVLIADDLTETQIKAFRISVNKMADLAEWDNELLALEMEELKLEGFDLDLTGFDAVELDELLGEIQSEPEPQEMPAGIDYQEKFAVLVACEDELSQTEVYDRLTGMGYACKVLVN